MASREVVYQGKKFELSYELVNPANQDAVLVLHGWGSNKEIMMGAFSNYLKNLKHLYMDLPGFGRSTNEFTLTTQEYAGIVRAFCESMQLTPKIIMGHSFGGKVATLLQPECLVLLSSSGILVPKPFGVRAKIALFKFLKPLGLSRLRNLFVSADAKGMSEAMYGTFKNVVNEEFEEHFVHYKGNAILFWGKQDSATPLWTAEKIVTLTPKGRLFPLEGDHYFFLGQGTFISSEIEKLCLKS